MFVAHVLVCVSVFVDAVVEGFSVVVRSAVVAPVWVVGSSTKLPVPETVISKNCTLNSFEWERVRERERERGSEREGGRE